MTNDELASLGPLATLVGTWEGDKGTDTAPSAERGTRISKYRERTTFVPTGRVDNHEQILFGLRYATVGWRVGEPNPYHEEVGYYLWDAANRQVMRCFAVPRGIVVNAGGTAEADARSFAIAAELGSPIYGICSNPFLDVEFKTVRFEMTLTIVDGDTYRYDEDTVIVLKGRTEPFHHTDGNTLRRVG